MSNTIEELAKQYAKYQTDERGYGSMEEWRQGVAIYYDDAKEVLSWLFNKSLALRLTTEEKERVKALHNHLNSVLAYCHPSADKIVEATMHDLEYIFGADFFKEGE